MYKTLHDFTQHPAPHSRFTAKEMWTRPHLARRMLQFHLDQNTELASRPVMAIASIIECNLMGGFWAEGDYVGMQRTILYPDEALSLDRVLIIEPTESWQIFNWFQYFTPQRLSEELSQARFKIDTLMGSLAGDPLTDDGKFMGVIATR